MQLALHLLCNQKSLAVASERARHAVVNHSQCGPEPLGAESECARAAGEGDWRPQMDGLAMRFEVTCRRQSTGLEFPRGRKQDNAVAV